MRRYLPAVLIVTIAGAAHAETFYASPNGSTSGDGSPADPWPVNHAISQLDGGDTLLLMDGLYAGRVSTSRAFSDWVTIRAERAYRAKLTNVQNGAPALSVYTQGSAKIIIDGFVISNRHPSYVCSGREAEFLVHFQDARDVIFRNNIVFGNNAPGTCNELIKINRGGDPYYPKNIQITGNVIYDHANAGGADMIDSVRGGELDITENIFFARNADQAQSFITLKREVDARSLGITPRSPRHNISKNVFLNWDGQTDQAFIQLGEDGYAEVMISDALIENNLIVGNSPRDIAGAFQFKGVKNITVRANTVVGDLPGGAYGFRIGTEENNLPVEDIFIYNNIFSDPTGTMGSRFINTYGDVVVSSIDLDNNLYFNDANPLPTTDSPAPTDDASRIVADPLLEPDHAGLVLPVWDENNHRFPSGSTTIRGEFERLVNACGAVGEGSPAVGAADAGRMPPEDILGRARDTNPDIGAFELAGAVKDGGTDGGDAARDGSDPGDAGAGDDGAPADEAADSGTGEESDGTDGVSGECGCGRGPVDGFGLLALLVILSSWSRRNAGRRRPSHWLFPVSRLRCTARKARRRIRCRTSSE
jgi:hypothetical protein